MKNVEQLHAATTVLDFLGSPKTQFVFISREDYERTWGKLTLGEPQGKVYMEIKAKSNIPIIASYCADGFDFIFIDPQELVDLKNKNHEQKHLS